MKKLSDTILTNVNENMFIALLIYFMLVYIIIKIYYYINQLVRTKIEERSEKIKNMKMANKRIENSNGVTLSMPERIELTNSILDLMTFMITNEIMSYMKSFLSLNVKYEVSNLDTDIKKISETVFHGINPTLFTDPNLILTSEYLMSYITKKTTNIFLETVMNYNQTLRAHSMGTGEDE